MPEFNKDPKILISNLCIGPTFRRRAALNLEKFGLNRFYDFCILTDYPECSYFNNIRDYEGVYIVDINSLRTERSKRLEKYDLQFIDEREYVKYTKDNIHFPMSLFRFQFKWELIGEYKYLFFLDNDFLPLGSDEQQAGFRKWIEDTMEANQLYTTSGVLDTRQGIDQTENFIKVYENVTQKLYGKKIKPESLRYHDNPTSLLKVDSKETYKEWFHVWDTVVYEFIDAEDEIIRVSPLGGWINHAEWTKALWYSISNIKLLNPDFIDIQLVHFRTPEDRFWHTYPIGKIWCKPTQTLQEYFKVNREALEEHRQDNINIIKELIDEYSVYIHNRELHIHNTEPLR